MDNLENEYKKIHIEPHVLEKPNIYNVVDHK